MTTGINQIEKEDQMGYYSNNLQKTREMEALSQYTTLPKKRRELPGQCVLHSRSEQFNLSYVSLMEQKREKNKRKIRVGT
uniref:Uncharacterized protein n=1 Tax=Romanomermis culicivorax TaxID=13658 RepID=A0A915KTV3_ROMCU